MKIDENGLLEDVLVGQSRQDNSWVNACTYVFRKEVFKYLQEKSEIDKRLIPDMAKCAEVAVYRHDGFWSPVETGRDKTMLERSWLNQQAPWKIWKN